MDLPPLGMVDGMPVRPVSIDIGSGIRITILDLPAAIERIDEAIDDELIDPYSTTLWPASIAIARELPHLVSPGDQVLDLGAGTGLAALSAAYLGADVTAYDHDAFALRLIEEAAQLQGLTVDTILFDLHSPEELPPADLIVVGDLLYDYDLADSVARRVADQIGYGGRAIVADPGRVAAAVFVDYLEELGFTGERHAVTVSTPDDDHTGSIIVHLFP